MMNFDVIVVGAGHAGVEAAFAAARVGVRVLVLTSDMNKIAVMSCNPAIGGLAKGHMVREIDVLGGEMGVVTDKSCIQFKRLNSRKGPAVRGSRAQCDKEIYATLMGERLKSYPNVKVQAEEVQSLILEKDQVCGVVTKNERKAFAKTVILTTGTFMNGVMHMGDNQESGGRVGESATCGLSDQLNDFGFEVRRLKTGTPARLAKESINFERMEVQRGDEVFRPFSLRSSKELVLPQVVCHMGYTNPRTHDVIRKNFHKSPMFSGKIEGLGPRYCPSIEDKVERFSEKDRHQTFLEPEGLNTNSIYLQGISTSLPIAVQDEFLRTIEGLENVRVLRYGYAVEYDFIMPTEIRHTLETRKIKGLYFAGQINGTSGYEEAAAQGLMAGTNAARNVLGKDPFILARNEAYIGVLIDDLVTKGTKEPYRMFTSRAEFRLNLREDNTLERLLEIGHKNLLVQDVDYEKLSALKEKRSSLMNDLSKRVLTPKPQVQKALQEMGSPVLQKPQSFKQILRRSEISYLDLRAFDIEITQNVDVYEPVEIAVKYEGYISRQDELIAQAKKLESLELDESFPFESVKGLSKEEIEKLSKIQPRTLGQASRISGVNPSAIQAIMLYHRANRSNLNKATAH